MRSLLLAAALLQGCAYSVRATGVIQSAADGVVITASNQNTRPLRLDAGSAPLRYADGLLVELEGTLRRDAIDVERWRVVEGPHGLSAWVGRVVPAADGGVALSVLQEGGTWTLDGPAVDALEDHVGRVVLVEGLVSGPLEIRTVHWQLLEGS